MSKPEFMRGILSSDFEQTFEMLRHYDAFHWDITKFCFGQICVIIGACWYLYEKNPVKSENDAALSTTAIMIICLLIASALFTFLCIISLLRNRLYFCKVSHYINELRQFSLGQDNGIDFQNNSGMWTNPSFPKILDWGSTQFLSIYLLIICMIGASGFATYMFFSNPPWYAIVVAIVAPIILVLLIGLCVLHDSHDNPTPSSPASPTPSEA